MANQFTQSGRKRCLVNLCLAVFLTVIVTAHSALAQQPVAPANENAKDLFVEQLHKPSAVLSNGLSYTIELHRAGQTPILCSADDSFYSGDGIAIHIKTSFTGYAYIALAEGTTGKQARLFPSPASPQNNLLHAGQEYVLPGNGLIRFDNNPGIEHLVFILSRTAINVEEILSSRQSISLSKGLTRVPDGISVGSDSNRTEPGSNKQHSATYVVQRDPSSLVFVDVALNHLSLPDTRVNNRSSEPGDYSP